MTDQASCTGYYQQRHDVQLNKSAFYISMRGRGGVEGYRVRFDDGPTSELRLATWIEKSISSIILSEADMRKLLVSKRLRISGLTVLSTAIEIDIDLTGVSLAHAVLAGAECS